LHFWSLHFNQLTKFVLSFSNRTKLSLYYNFFCNFGHNLNFTSKNANVSNFRVIWLKKMLMWKIKCEKTIVHVIILILNIKYLELKKKKKNSVFFRDIKKKLSSTIYNSSSLKSKSFKYLQLQNSFISFLHIDSLPPLSYQHHRSKQRGGKFDEDKFVER